MARKGRVLAWFMFLYFVPRLTLYLINMIMGEDFFSEAPYSNQDSPRNWLPWLWRLANPKIYKISTSNPRTDDDLVVLRVQRPAVLKSTKSWCFSLSPKAGGKKQYSSAKTISRENSLLLGGRPAYLFYLGL